MPGTGAPDGCAVRRFHRPREELLITGGILVEEVVGRVRDERLCTDVC